MGHHKLTNNLKWCNFNIETKKKLVENWHEWHSDSFIFEEKRLKYLVQLRETWKSNILFLRQRDISATNVTSLLTVSLVVHHYEKKAHDRWSYWTLIHHFHLESQLYIYIYIYCIRGACGLMVIIARNGHTNLHSSPKQNCLHFT